MKLPIGAQTTRPAPDDPLQAKILALLGAGEITLDELCATTGATTSQVLAALSVLELQRAIETRAGQRFTIASGGKRC